MTELSASAVSVEDIAYREVSGAPLMARLYRPAGRGPFPAVVSVHGGRWTSESRLTNAALDQAMAAAGIIVMAIDFRMPPTVQYPVPVADINYAVRWLKQRTAEFDLGPVGGIGTSSGGHQLLLVGLRPDDARYNAAPLPEGSTQNARLAFMVLCWPVSEPVSRFHMVREKNMAIHVRAHLDYWPDEAAAAEGSPHLILERGEPVALPPALVIQGTNDTILPPGMSDRFAERYRRSGGSIELENFANQPHTFITKDPAAPASLRAIQTINGFILRQK